jgi:endoglucanase
MTKLKEFLKAMISESGLSGYEVPVRKIIESEWEHLTDELSVSKLGSLHGLQRGLGKTPRKRIMVATHMDAIGLIVTKVHEGFLHITQIGGIDPRILPGQLVTVHSQDGDLPGIVLQPPGHTLPEDVKKGVVPLKHLLVDVGLSVRQVSRRVQVGDPISFATQPLEMGDNLLAGHSMDNRASVAALTETLRLTSCRNHDWDIWAVATSQEEESLGGAKTSGFQLRPDIAVVIDVTFARSPGTAAHESYDMNKGPTLGWGPNAHPKLHKEFKDLAKKFEIPTQIELMPRSSGTDAIPLQVTAEGIPTAIIGLPLRYIHTPVELVHLNDIRRAARLLAEFICTLDDSFMDKLALDADKSETKRNSQ